MTRRNEIITSKLAAFVNERQDNIIRLGAKDSTSIRFDILFGSVLPIENCDR